MINRQLEVNINKEKILTDLANNLNIDFITDGSNLKKMADTYSAENVNYATNVDDAIANGFLTTMSSEFLELFGNQNGVYRKNYNNIAIYNYQEAVSLSVNKIDAMVTEIDAPYVVYKKGDLIYADDNIVIECITPISISGINDVKYASVTISLANSLNSYTVPENSEYSVTSTNQTLTNLLPTFTLKFNRPVGLAVLQEIEEDYKLRIYESTYIANNGANSLISSVAKEVPFITFLEVDDYTNGRAIKTIYPYTQEIVNNGMDSYLDILILPLIESNLRGKVLNGQFVEVLKPEALILNVNLTFNNNNRTSNVLLENVKTAFNNFFVSYKQINREVLEDFIKSELGVNSTDLLGIDFIFTSPYVSEETFTLTAESSDIILPKGRFIHLSSITRTE